MTIEGQGQEWGVGMTRRNVSILGLTAFALLVAVLVVVAVKSPGAAAPSESPPVVVTVTQTIGDPGHLGTRGTSRGSLPSDG